MPLMPTVRPGATPSFQDPTTLLTHAITLQEAGRVAEAKSIYEHLITLEPRRADIMTFLGVALCQLKQRDEALRMLDRSLRLAPDQPNALHARGVCLFNLNHLEASLESFDSAIRFGSDQSHKSRAVILTMLGRYDEALEALQHARRIHPSDPELYNIAVPALTAQRRFKEALALLDHVISVRPDDAIAHFAKACILLMMGDFDTGWDEMEWRWKLDKARATTLPLDRPIWLGDASVEGKSILLFGEQGLGDVIQMSRFAPAVAALGAKVTLQVAALLVPVMQTLHPEIRVLAKNDTPPPFDMSCPLMSLPKALKLQPDGIPAPKSYLSALPERQAAWSARLGPRTRPRVGLVWFGSFLPGAPRLKSMAFEDILQVIDADADFFSLQKQHGPGEEGAFQRHESVVDLGTGLNDFADTAAAMSQLDLIITVDTASAHLAGALGIPVWVLLQFQPEWRWPDGDTTPWYPTARLFRQSVSCDWSRPLAAVRTALHEWLVSQRPTC